MKTSASARRAPSGPPPPSLAPPESELEVCVVVPALDEEQHIAQCLDALARQVELEPHRYEVLLVLDACSDDTESLALETARLHPQLRLHLLRGPGCGTGGARRAGMDVACDRLLAAGRPGGLIASTDADSTVAADWIGAQLAVAARGARAIGGRVELSEEGRAGLPEGVAAIRDELAGARMEAVRREPNGPEGELRQHWQFSGASLAVTASAYLEIGGLEPRTALEDEALERALKRHNIAIARPLSVRVTTSARTDGRAFRGLSRDLAISSWVKRRSFDSANYGLERLLELKSESVTVILPTLDMAGTIEPVLSALIPLRRAGLVDELVVVDYGSADETSAGAKRSDVIVWRADELCVDYGRARGKGDAMWRGLAATTGDTVAFLDPSTEIRAAHLSKRRLIGLLGPLFEDANVKLVKGWFREPLPSGDVGPSGEGGGVTELLVRPFLNLYLPELAGFLQPLAGETAARRRLLESVSFPVGDGVDIAILIDALRLEGIDALAQVDLGIRCDGHQPVNELSAMAYAVLAAASARVHGREATEVYAPGPLVQPGRERFEVHQVPVEERPPLAGVTSSSPLLPASAPSSHHARNR